MYVCTCIYVQNLKARLETTLWTWRKLLQLFQLPFNSIRQNYIFNSNFNSNNLYTNFLSNFCCFKLKLLLSKCCGGCKRLDGRNINQIFILDKSSQQHILNECKEFLNKGVNLLKFYDSHDAVIIHNKPFVIFRPFCTLDSNYS